jgi:UDP-glucuronate 4-epimerase
MCTTPRMSRRRALLTTALGGVSMRILVTGAAGFIGMQVSQRLLEAGHTVFALDNFNDYYEVSLKEVRVATLAHHAAFHLTRGDVADTQTVGTLFARAQPERVIHLAAQAGVRYSLTHPHAYVQSNLVGFGNILESCRAHQVAHLIYASSSSVYGANRDVPFTEAQRVDHPVSFYAATKRANELMAHAFSHTHKLATTGLRFFTVYGPWGRPDMSPALFVKAIFAGEPIKVFNHGHMKRDFTFVDDVAASTVALALSSPHNDALQAVRATQTPTGAPYAVMNIGNQAPVPLLDYIGAIEAATGRVAEKILLPMQTGDVEETSANTAQLASVIGQSPHTPLAVGVARYVQWYRQYYGIA